MSVLTLAMTERAVGAAQPRARELGTPITVSVVDDDGRLVLCARGDGTGFLTPETSRALRGNSLSTPRADEPHAVLAP